MVHSSRPINSLQVSLVYANVEDCHHSMPQNEFLHLSYCFDLNISTVGSWSSSSSTVDMDGV